MPKQSKQRFEQTYPHITRWIKSYGWIEIGGDDFSDSFVRALNIGGLIWEGRGDYATMDDMLHALEEGLAEWMREQLGED